MIDSLNANRDTFTISSDWQMRRNYLVFGNTPRRVCALSDPTDTQILFYDAEGIGFHATLPAGRIYNVYSYNPVVLTATGTQSYGAPILAGVSGTVFIAASGRDTVVLCVSH